ncbi:MAG: hypothetical protein ACI8S6_001664 [Myxococcota bacterium]|jgi:hypothetical protein
MMRLLTIAVLLLVGCGPDPAQHVAPNSTVVEQAIRTARPGPLLELPALLRDLVPAEGGCPHVEVLEATDAVPTRELWTGGCQLSDGTLIDGALELVERDDEQWLAGDAFTVSRGGELELYLDGTIEAVEQQQLLLLDAAATWCGGDAAPCADGLVTVDLSYSIYPADGYPDAYDVTVTGVVAPGAPIAVEGSWSVDLSTCPGEPTDGVFALRQGERHDLTLDGAVDCDACADWTVQGIPVTDYCGVEF